MPKSLHSIDGIISYLLSFQISLSPLDLELLDFGDDFPVLVLGECLKGLGADIAQSALSRAVTAMSFSDLVTKQIAG